MTMTTDARTIKTGTLHRSAMFDRAAIDEAARTVSLAFSSETPVARWFGNEVLDHAPGSVMLGRLQNAGPLLLDHDPSEQIGVVEGVTLGADRMGRAQVRFSRSEDAEAIFQDVRDGIRQHVSVGYRVHKMVLESTDGDTETYRATQWEPLEISIVSIPADTAVGIGRAAPTDQAFETVIEGGTRALTAPVSTPAPETSTMTAPDITVIENARADALTQERTRTAEIAALGDLHAKRGGDKLAAQFIRSGKSLDEFRAALLDAAAKEPVTDTVNLNEREAKQYSYVRAIAAALARAEGQAVSGFEAEISQDIERNIPANYKRNGGIFVPLQVRSAISEALYNTSGKGASTVFTQPGEFIDMLRNASVAVGLGARVMGGLTGPVSFPSQTAGASTYWVAESTAVTESEATFGQVSLSPKTVGMFTDYSRRAMLQTTPAIEALVRADLAGGLAVEIDRAGIAGSGAAGQPRGIINTAGIGSVAGGTNGAAPTYAHMVALEEAVSIANADVGNMAVFTNAKMRAQLRLTQVFASTNGAPVWASDNTVMGYRAEVSNNVPSNLTKGTAVGTANAILFGNFSDVLMGMWSGLDLILDPYALATAGGRRIVALQDVDVAVRRAASFAAMLDALRV